MSVAEGTRETLAAKFGAIFPHLDERQRRLLMGAEARALGHGGIRVWWQPVTTPLTTLADLTAYARAQGITLTPKTKPAR